MNERQMKARRRRKLKRYWGGRGSSSGMRMSLKATKYVRGMNGRARGRKKRYTKFVTHILKWQLALV